MSELKGRTAVYLAGPQHSPEERWGMNRLATVLEESGFEVFMEWRDGIASVLSMPDDPTLERAAFALDVYQVTRGCDCLVFDMNGRVPDTRGSFLAAVAFTAGRPVVLYKKDHRTELHGSDNAMISGLSHDFSFVKDPARIPAKVSKAVLGCRESERPASLPPLVELNAEVGLEIRESLERFKEKGEGADPAGLLEEISKACEASGVFRP